MERCLKSTHKLIQVACKQKNIFDKPKIVLGLSGGPDSMFLLHVLSELKRQKFIEFVAAYFDHQWRCESAKDVVFCRELCKRFKVKFFTAKTSDYSLGVKANGSKEDLGRKMRRLFFKQVLQQNKAHFIALAHHHQDQQETFFMRLLRGTSLTGLCCMEEIEGDYIRPLLSINKTLILEYLEKSGIKYLIDSSNESEDYLRNRIRKFVIPAFQQCDLRFDQKFKSTLLQLKNEDEYLKHLVEVEFNKIFELKQKRTQGKLDKFRVLHFVPARRVILFWLIRERLSFDLSTNYLDEIIKFLVSNRGGRHRVGRDWEIVKVQNCFWIEK